MTTLHGKLDILTNKVNALAASQTAQDAVLQQILAEVKSSVAPPPPPPPVSDWPLAVQPLAGVTVTLTAGVKTSPSPPGGWHPDNAGVTLRGAGMRATILDGRGGAGSGSRLAWGKGIVHSTLSVTIQDMGFVRGGRGDLTSDGEAGAYCQSGDMRLLRCAFDSCENGVYGMPREFTGADGPGFTTIESCVFGRAGANGLGDGRSHDVYLGGKGAKITKTIFAGNARGNTIKVRGNTLLLEDNWISRTNGRFVDLPGGTECNSRRNVYVTAPGAEGHYGSNNAFGFFNEDDVTNTDNAGSFLSEDDTFIFGPRQTEVIWIQRPTFRVEFIRPKVFWYGAAAPSVEIYGAGNTGRGVIAGVNPFVFTADNRLAGPPPMPADPV